MWVLINDLIIYFAAYVLDSGTGFVPGRRTLAGDKGRADRLRRAYGRSIEVIENLRAMEDDGEPYESIEEMWPDYPTADDDFYFEEE